MRIAIIDLGTNTCNILISEISGVSYKMIYQGKLLVRLGDYKISENRISNEATQRVINAFISFQKQIHDYGVEQTIIIATSAVRSAANSKEFIQEITRNNGWKVEVVSGEREAELIFKGVLLAFGGINDPHSILDIGGGSCEIIIAFQNQLQWKESQPSGMARVINRFKISNPITQNEISQLELFYSDIHRNAIQKIRELNIKTLIGCSGAFDTIADLIDGVNPSEKQRITQGLNPDDFNNVFEMLVRSTHAERMEMKGMDFVRVDLIVPAVILIKTLIRKTGIEEIIQTDFALREGVLYDKLKGETAWF